MGDFFSGASEGLDIAANLALKRREMNWEKEQFEKNRALKILQMESEADQALTKNISGILKDEMKTGIEQGSPEMFRHGSEGLEKLHGIQIFPREETAGPGLPEGIAGPPSPIEQIKAPMTALELKEKSAKLTEARQLGVEGAKQKNREELARLKAKLKGTKDKELTPTQKAAQKKAEVLERYLKGEATEREIRAYKLEPAPKTPTPSAPGVKAKREMDISAKIKESEQKIVGAKPDDPQVQAEIDFFNQYSDKPYVYVIGETPGKLYGTNPAVMKARLGKINGKQVTAQDIYHTATTNSMTVEEVLEQLGFKNKQVVK